MLRKLVICYHRQDNDSVLLCNIHSPIDKKSYPLHKLRHVIGQKKLIFFATHWLDYGRDVLFALDHHSQAIVNCPYLCFTIHLSCLMLVISWVVCKGGDGEERCCRLRCATQHLRPQRRRHTAGWSAADCGAPGVWRHPRSALQCSASCWGHCC